MTRTRKLSSLEARRQYLQEKFLKGLRPYGAIDTIKHHRIEIINLQDSLAHDPILRAVQQRHHHQRILLITEEMLKRQEPDFQQYFQSRQQEAQQELDACELLISGG